MAGAACEAIRAAHGAVGDGLGMGFPEGTWWAGRGRVLAVAERDCLAGGSGGCWRRVAAAVRMWCGGGATSLERLSSRTRGEAFWCSNELSGVATCRRPHRLSEPEEVEQEEDAAKEERGADQGRGEQRTDIVSWVFCGSLG